MTHIFRKRGAVTRDFYRRAEFEREVYSAIAKATQLYPQLQGIRIPVVFFKQGQTAGWAKWRMIGGVYHYNLEFNIEAIQGNWDDMVGDTIPHEIAHIVDHVVHGVSHGHGATWKRIARSLGCTGKRCHNYKISRARRTTKYRYVASCGTEVWLSKQMHNKVQLGQVRVLNKTRGRITASHCTGHRKVVG